MSLKPFILLLPFLVVACHAHQASLNTVPASSSPTPGETSSPSPQTPGPAITPTPEHEISFGKGLKIVPVSLKLENENRRYRIDALYPRVEGSKSRSIQNLNQHIKNVVTSQHQWLLKTPTKEDQRHFQKWPGVFNSMDLDYEVILATDKLLSIYFDVYSYGIGAAHSVQYSFTLNFDLSSERLLSLSELFRRDAKHLEFISQYCMSELSKEQVHIANDPAVKEELLPKPKNFESWNITNAGLRFNFDACRIAGCANGKQEVVIGYNALKEKLNPGGPLTSLAESN